MYPMSVLKAVFLVNTCVAFIKNNKILMQNLLATNSIGAKTVTGQLQNAKFMLA